MATKISLDELIDAIENIAKKNDLSKETTTEETKPIEICLMGEHNFLKVGEINDLSIFGPILRKYIGYDSKSTKKYIDNLRRVGVIHCLNCEDTGQNFSFVASILCCVKDNFSKMSNENQIMFIDKTIKRIIKKNKKLDGQSSVSFENEFEKMTDDSIYAVCNFFDINIIVFDISVDDIFVYFVSDTFNKFRQTILVTKFQSSDKSIFEYIFLDGSTKIKIFDYNNHFFRYVLNKCKSLDIIDESYNEILIKTDVGQSNSLENIDTRDLFGTCVSEIVRIGVVDKIDDGRYVSYMSSIMTCLGLTDIVHEKDNIIDMLNKGTVYAHHIFYPFATTCANVSSMIDNYIINNMTMRVIAFCFQVNIIILNINTNEINIVYNDDLFDLQKKTICLIQFNDFFEPIAYVSEKKKIDLIVNNNEKLMNQMLDVMNKCGKILYYSDYEQKKIFKINDTQQTSKIFSKKKHYIETDTELPEIICSEST